MSLTRGLAMLGVLAPLVASGCHLAHERDRAADGDVGAPEASIGDSSAVCPGPPPPVTIRSCHSETARQACSEWIRAQLPAGWTPRWGCDFSLASPDPCVRASLCLAGQPCTCGDGPMCTGGELCAEPPDAPGRPRCVCPSAL